MLKSLSLLFFAFILSVLLFSVSFADDFGARFTNDAPVAFGDAPTPSFDDKFTDETIAADFRPELIEPAAGDEQPQIEPLLDTELAPVEPQDNNAPQE